MTDRWLFQQVAFHLLMGGALGAVFAAVLLASNAEHLLQIIQQGSAPITTLMIFVCGISTYFGFGAALTGFHFVIMDDRRGRGP